MTTKTEAERKEFLGKLGLNPDAPALVAEKPKKAKKDKPKAEEVEVPVDSHTMPVSDIVFDESLLDDFPDLSGTHYKLASAHVFDMYKGKRGDTERNALLHRRITEFIGQVKRSRKTGGFVKEKIKATEEQREIANVLAAHNVTMEDLAELLKGK